MTFQTLALVVAVGLLGPILAAPRRWRVPILAGELAGGIALGPTGANQLHPGDRTFTFLANIGFALVMFVAGSHLPVRDRRLLASMRIGSLRAIAVGAISAGLGAVVAAGFDTGHGALYAVVIASSSAALILPTLDSLGLTKSPPVLELLPQVAIADAASIVALPLVIDPARAAHAALGSIVVIAAALVVFLVLDVAERRGLRRRLHDLSEQRRFALELRISLLVLFALAAIAVRAKVSIMLAGFAFGLAIAGIGEPRRLAKQLFALTEGFFAPLFFVWIGASIDVRALGAHPKYLLLGFVLAAAALVAHVAMRATGQPALLGVVAAAQLGVPIAAVTLGTQQHLLRRGEPAALLLGALATVAATTIAAALAARNAIQSPAATARSRAGGDSVEQSGQ